MDSTNSRLEPRETRHAIEARQSRPQPPGSWQAGQPDRCDPDALCPGPGDASDLLAGLAIRHDRGKFELDERPDGLIPGWLDPPRLEPVDEAKKLRAG